MLMLGDVMTLPAIIGCLFIFAGIILSQLDFKKNKKGEVENATKS